MAKVYLFNIEKGKAIKIKLLCRQFFMEATEVPKEDFGCKMSSLLGMTADGERAANADFSEEMLFFADVNNGGMFGIFLDQLERRGLSVALKAVQTDANVHFTAYALYRELAAEHAAFTSGTIR